MISLRIFSADDENEISKRLTQLQLSLGLSQEKVFKRQSLQSITNDKSEPRDSDSKTHDHHLYIDKDEYATFSEKTLSQRELSKYLRNRTNQKLQFEFESTFGPIADNSKVNDNDNDRSTDQKQNGSSNNALIHDESTDKKLLSSERIGSLGFFVKPENQVTLPMVIADQRARLRLKQEFDNSINSVKLLNRSVN